MLILLEQINKLMVFLSFIDSSVDVNVKAKKAKPKTNRADCKLNVSLNIYHLFDDPPNKKE